MNSKEATEYRELMNEINEIDDETMASKETLEKIQQLAIAATEFLDSPDITKQDVIDMSEAVNQAAKELDSLLRRIQ